MPAKSSRARRAIPVATSTLRERRLEEILTRLPHGVLLVDRSREIEFINPEARRLLRDRSLAPGDSLNETRPEFALGDLADELFSRREPPDDRLVEVEGSAVCVGGLPSRDAETVILTLDDVTARERSRRAERQFIENAAHELRTPLAAIVSVVDVLQAGAKDEPDARDRFLDHLRLHSERLARLATSLLTLARIQAGREAPRLEVVRIRALLDEVVRELAPARGVQFVVRAPETVAALADRELLHRMVSNIATNAVKNTTRGEIVFEARQHGPTTQLEVRDTGRGMSRVDREHAFDRFHRATDSDGDGFGLGLAIADEAAQTLGGSLRLESSPGEGTRVLVELPAARIVS